MSHVKHGWLMKQARSRSKVSSWFVKNWKKRYVVLDDGILYYYENISPLGVPPYGEGLKDKINLSCCQVIEPSKSLEKTKTRFLITGLDEVDIMFEAETSKLAKEWVDAIRIHCRIASNKSNNSIQRNNSLDNSRNGTNGISTDRPTSQENKAIDKIIFPIPCFVMKVIRINTREKVFINVCQHADVPLSIGQLPVLRGTNKWPYMISSSSRTCPDEKDNTPIIIYDVLINEQIAVIIESDEQAKDEVCQKVIRHIKKYYKEEIEENYRTLKIAKKYKGDLTPYNIGNQSTVSNITPVKRQLSLPITNDTTTINSTNYLSEQNISQLNRSNNNQANRQYISQEESKIDSKLNSKIDNKITSPKIQFKRFPYEIVRQSGVMLKSLPENGLSIKIIPNGETIYAKARILDSNDVPWLQTNQGWIPEKLQGQGKPILHLINHKPPIHSHIINTRFIELTTNKSFLGYLSSYFYSNKNEAKCDMIFTIEFEYTNHCILKFFRSANELLKLSNLLITSKTITNLPFPLYNYHDSTLLLDPLLCLEAIESIDQWLNKIIKHISTNKIINEFFKPNQTDIFLMESELMIPDRLDSKDDDVSIIED